LPLSATKDQPLTPSHKYVPIWTQSKLHRLVMFGCFLCCLIGGSPALAAGKFTLIASSSLRAYRVAHPSQRRSPNSERLRPFTSCLSASSAVSVSTRERTVKPPNQVACLFGQAYHHLWHVVGDDVYRQFTYVDNAIRPSFPTPPLMLACRRLPSRIDDPSRMDEVTLFRELSQPRVAPEGCLGRLPAAECQVVSGLTLVTTVKGCGFATQLRIRQGREPHSSNTERHR
jgi:hypothetical protein